LWEILTQLANLILVESQSGVSGTDKLAAA